MDGEAATAQLSTAEPTSTDWQIDEETDLRWEELATEISDVFNCHASAGCYGTSYPATFGDTHNGLCRPGPEE